MMETLLLTTPRAGRGPRGPRPGPRARAPEQNLGPRAPGPRGPPVAAAAGPPVVGLCPGHDPGSPCVTFSVTFLRHNFLNFRSSCNSRYCRAAGLTSRPGPIPLAGRALALPAGRAHAARCRPPPILTAASALAASAAPARGVTATATRAGAPQHRRATHTDLNSLSHENILSSSSRADAATAFLLE